MTARKAFKKARSAANGALDAMSKTYWPHVPVGEIAATFRLLGLSIAEEGFLLCGHDGQASLALAFDGEPVANVLRLSWHRMEVTGKFELTAYVS